MRKKYCGPFCVSSYNWSIGTAETYESRSPSNQRHNRTSCLIECRDILEMLVN
jgi:hypothetical protein